MKQCANGHFFDEVRFPECPYCADSQSMGKTVAAQPLDKTVGLNQPVTPAADRGKTVGLIKKDIGIDPAVGFVICVSGPHKGADFKLHSGRNFLGRAASMDVSLSDDETVSRENHALISYDARHNAFALSPGLGRGITYRNEAQVEAAVELQAYDVIEAGKSRLIFLPFCCDRFKWDEAK